jgi:hypothetical protein
MKTSRLATTVMFALALGSTVAGAQVTRPAIPGLRLAPAPQPVQADAVVFDQGLDTGSSAACHGNVTQGQNFADRVTFEQDTVITGIRIFTCIAPEAEQVRVKVHVDNGADAPGELVYEQNGMADAWVEVDTIEYAVTVNFDTPFVASAGEQYWYGISGNGFELAQYVLQTPDDGEIAQFDGTSFDFHSGVGDQAFQLLGGQADVGATITGVTGLGAICINRNTQQRLPVLLAGAAAVNCSDAGLDASPGDEIVILVRGEAQ